MYPLTHRPADPRSAQTQYGYNQRGQVTSLTDPQTNVTQWSYDVQGRLTSKQYPDTSAVTYACTRPPPAG